MPVGTVPTLNMADMADRLNNINNISFKSEPITRQVSDEDAGAFNKILQSAMDTLAETGNYQIKASELQTDFATGRTDDMLAVMLAQEKAYFSLNFTVQVTNKLVEAYKEIMRMQL